MLGQIEKLYYPCRDIRRETPIDTKLTEEKGKIDPAAPIEEENTFNAKLHKDVLGSYLSTVNSVHSNDTLLYRKFLWQVVDGQIELPEGIEKTSDIITWIQKVTGITNRRNLVGLKNNACVRRMKRMLEMAKMAGSGSMD